MSKMEVYITSTDVRGTGTTQSIAWPHAVWMDVVGASEKAYCMEYGEQRVWVPKSLCKIKSFYQIVENGSDDELYRLVELSMGKQVSAKDILLGEAVWFFFKEKFLMMEAKQNAEFDETKVVHITGDDVWDEIEKYCPGRYVICDC